MARRARLQRLSKLKRLVPIPAAVQALRGQLEKPPQGWQTRWPYPRRQKVCYRRKSDAVKVLLDRNQRLVDTYRGADAFVGYSEFDAINARFGLKGKRRVGTIGHRQ